MHVHVHIMCVCAFVCVFLCVSMAGGMMSAFDMEMGAGPGKITSQGFKPVCRKP
jgi:hypothetical protein